MIRAARIMMCVSVSLGIAAIGADPVAASAQRRIALPAGRLGDAVIALGRQSDTSIVVDDPALWARRVPAIDGAMSTREALDRLARAAGAEVKPAGVGNWRLVPSRPSRVAVRARVRPRPAPAVLPPPGEAAEIVVTASKRELPLRDYAGQVAQLSGSDLAFGGVRGTDAILARLASVSSTYLGAGRNKLFIRGVADSSFTGPTQSTVGQYLDDVRLSYNAPDPDLQLYDIASVEVLEGPQGTLYGAGSLGGIIRTVPNVPVLDRTSGSVSAGLSATRHGDPGGDLGGVINVPLIEGRLALRATGYGLVEGGYIDNPVRGRDDINRTRTAGGRAMVRLDAGGGWTIDVGGVFQDTRGDDSQYADRDAPRLTRSSAVQQGFSADYALGQIVVSGTLGDIALRSTTAIVRQTLTERYDATMPASDPAEIVPRVFEQHNATRMIVNETRAWRAMRDGFGWVIGGSFTHNRTQLSRALGAVDATLPVTGVVNGIDEATLYGEASAMPIAGLTLTGGARIARADVSGGADDVPMRLMPISAATVIARAAVTAKRSETSLLPSASVIASLLPRLSLYARYQEGFRPGGLAIESDFVRRFDNDRVRTLETGVRFGRAAGDPVKFTVALSHTRWTDIQADFIDGSGLPSTANIGDGRIWTLSATGAWQPLAGLTFDLGYTYNDSRVEEPSETYLMALALASGASGRKSEVPNIARHTGRVGIDYRRTIGNGDLTLRAYGWARYVGNSRLGIGPVLGAVQGDYVDTAAAVRIGRPELGLTLGITNLTDSVGNRFALGTPFQIDASQITPMRPRTLRIGLDAQF